ncbi:MAG: N-acetylglucosaminyl-diphospho-decaprenol L-rhamnosyltransferase [Betaproteobacteria bacterium ADurb.Bin341]|nr:MAG: N-acetylglucosaminyl-diphospho-decaprenol L-rhamnosyltransferase [Betaproteobacteria bacterium ADurb.Bin341]
MTDSAISKVSVIVVNFNAGKTLPRCLQALTAQTLPAARIIVVDNASSDGSIEAVQAQFPGIETFVLKENTGFAAANNLAIQLCNSEFVALLNPDAFPEKNWLEELVKAAETRPQAASFGSCQLMANDPRHLDGVEDVCHISGLIWRKGHGRQHSESDRQPRKIFSPCAAAALYRLQALRQVGGFDPDFFCYVEDVDLGFRLRLLGWQSWYVPTAVVLHIGSVTTGGMHSRFAVYHGHRNLVWMFCKNMPALLLWPLAPLHLAMNLVSVLWFSLRGHGCTIFKAKLDALLGLPKIWKKRTAIQKTRTISAWQVFSMLNRDLIPHRSR